MSRALEHEKINIEMRGRGFSPNGGGWINAEKQITIAHGFGTKRPWYARIDGCDYGRLETKAGSLRTFTTPMQAADAALGARAEWLAKDDR